MTKKFRKEADVKDAIKTILKRRGAWYYMPVQTGYGQHGIPDFVVCYKGYFVGIEAKFAKGKPTAWQRRQIEAIDRAGGVSLVINEHGLEALEALLDRLTGLRALHRAAVDLARTLR